MQDLWILFFCSSWNNVKPWFHFNCALEKEKKLHRISDSFVRLTRTMMQHMHRLGDQKQGPLGAIPELRQPCGSPLTRLCRKSQDAGNGPLSRKLPSVTRHVKGVR